MSKQSTFLKLFISSSLTVASLNAGAFGAPAPEPTPKPKPAPKPAPRPEVIHEARWEPSNRDGREWTIHTYNEVEDLGLSMMSVKPADAEAFCPGFSKLSDSGRQNFYTYLLSAMSKFESNYNPSVKYQEAFNDRHGNPVISRGLLQISKESANGYGCGIGNEQELHDPETNLSCGIKILDRWIGRDGRIAGKVSGSWKGGARYWSVLRRDNTLSQIQQWTRSFCTTKLN